MSLRLTIHLHDEPIYDIVLEKDFGRLIDEISALYDTPRKFMIVTDTCVAPHYLDEVKHLLGGSSVADTVCEFVMPSGEAYKTLDTVRSLYESLIKNHFERKDVLLALGGGVVGDLTGYSAATYLRGVDFIQVPTTLLAQVDSSIGGKTGVDFDAYKNMVGAFHMPRLVYMNMRTLLTLDERIYLSGFGEIIKHAYIRDKAYLAEIIRLQDGILTRDLDVLEQIIYTSCTIKGSVVEIDPTEKFERMLLNFGHTLGHAMEKLSGFRLYHGECVVLGMLAALRICVNRGYLSEEEMRAATELFSSLHFPLTISGMTASDVITTSRSDKKMASGKIRFVLLHKVGEGFVDTTVSEEEMANALKGIIVS